MIFFSMTMYHTWTLNTWSTFNFHTVQQLISAQKEEIPQKKNCFHHFRSNYMIGIKTQTVQIMGRIHLIKQTINWRYGHRAQINYNEIKNHLPFVQLLQWIEYLPSPTNNWTKICQSIGIRGIFPSFFCVCK